MLNVGDEVEFELNRKDEPRYQYYVDRAANTFHLVDTGYSGNIVRGFVVSIHPTKVAEIVYNPTPASSLSFNVALEGHHAYDPTQWVEPGFPIPVKKAKPIKNCSCGSHATYGINNGAHSHWCDLRT